MSLLKISNNIKIHRAISARTDMAQSSAKTQAIIKNTFIYADDTTYYIVKPQLDLKWQGVGCDY